MNKKISTAGAILLFGLATASHAGLIVDTGEVSSSGGGYALDDSQWLAAEFILDQTYFITDIQGWLNTQGNVGQTFTITVYGDGGEVPDTSNLVYSNVATVVGVNGQVASWEGYHIGFGNGLELAAGSYWLGFEVRTGDTYSRSMPFPVSNPLANYAFNNSGSWLEFDALNIGVRVNGTAASVPEPMPLVPMGLGLLGLGLVRKLKREAGRLAS